MSVVEEIGDKSEAKIAETDSMGARHTRVLLSICSFWARLIDDTFQNLANGRIECSTENVK